MIVLHSCKAQLMRSSSLGCNSLMFWKRQGANHLAYDYYLRFSVPVRYARDRKALCRFEKWILTGTIFACF
jgi:hypothetical protein